jgi:hypothetical protein
MKRLIVSILTLVIGLSSCEKSDSPTLSDVIPGNISGHLEIYESNDHSGAFVSLKGTNISTQTDKDGKWLLENVNPGVYDIIFSKPGYDTTEVYGFQYTGNGTAYCEFHEILGATETRYYDDFTNWKIFKTNDNTAQNLKVEIEFLSDSISNVDTSFIFQGKVQKDESLVFFFGDKPNVTKNNYIDYYYPVMYSSENKSFDISLYKSEFEFYKITNQWKSGQKLYVIAYPGWGICQTDMRNSKSRWLCLGNSSNVVEFTVP